jgi:hypothetical protein
MATSPGVAARQTQANRDTLAARVVDFWWVEIPGKLRGYSTLLWAAWSDGNYLSAWPRIATVLVIATLLFGFGEGITHWSYRTIVGTNGFSGNVLAPSATADNWGGPTRLVFAENLLLLMVGVGLGSISANLGLTLVIGYVLGDLLRGPAATGPGWRSIDPFNAWIYRHVPLLVSYLLFFLLVCLPILTATELVRSLHPRVRQSKFLTVSMTAAVQALLIYCWACMAPMVFRTVWLWSGGAPRITVPFYSTVTATFLLPVAVVAIILRAALFRTASKRDRALRRIQVAAIQARQVRQRIPAWLRAVLVAGMITLILTGFLHTPANLQPTILTNFGEAEIIFIALTAVLLVSAYWLQGMTRWQRWTAQANQYPPGLRLGVATIGSYLVCRLIILVPGAQSSAAGEFGPEVAAILTGLGLTLVLLPNGWFGLPQGSRLLPRFKLRVPSPAAQASIVVFTAIFIILLAARKVFADCFDSQCCFAAARGVSAAAAAGAAAGGIPGLGGIAGAAAAAAAAAAKGAASAVAGNKSPATPDSEPAWKRDAATANGAIIGAVVGAAAGAILTSEGGPLAIEGGIEGASLGKEIGGLIGGGVGAVLAGVYYDAPPTSIPPGGDSPVNYETGYPGSHVNPG